ncbi:alpha/beta fold hydrolase [Ilumatobacter sp.]|uniref:alpha/beta fold hydrolase n=1 Tax=Ilumatobacter sp. TaxID=1967498 RepID=UPI003B52E77E
MTVGRVVLAHGFTQTARSWAAVADALRARLDGVTIAAPDLPGHGSSADVRCDLRGAADLLVARGDRAAYVGYSMGGRVALHAALAHPDAVERLVLIGATAGIEDPDERDARRRADQDLADRIVRSSIAAFVDEWLESPLFDGLVEGSASRDDRLTNTTRGLASSLRLCGTGTQDPLWDRLGEIRCPTLVLAGERDDKFRALGERLAAGIADARMAVIEGSGHSVHLEQPQATVDALADFLS